MSAFVLACVRAQVDSVLSEIARMEGSEFPYKHTQDALKETKKLFLEHKDSLVSIIDESDEPTVELVCSTAFVDLSETIDLLGFLLRSTNVRNAFEAYGPMLRIARKILGPDTKLIISSEWYFSPFAYFGYLHLPGFVLIGLPATESSDPFLLPLAGHELGHSAWFEYGLDKVMEKEIEQAIIEEVEEHWSSYKDFFRDTEKEQVGTELIPRTLWKPAWTWALSQCEEHFCDIFGLCIFGEAYLYAFAYSVAPKQKGLRSMNYPSHKARAQSLVEACERFGFIPPDKYVEQFTNLSEPTPNQRESTLLSLADAVRNKFVAKLQSSAESIIGKSGFPRRSAENVEKCRKRLSLMVPTERSNGLANILNAAWKGWLDPDFFLDKEHNLRRLGNLREVVLKSIEVLEIELKLEEKT